MRTMRAVQVSFDTDLLERIDDDPDARAWGRSAFIRRALRIYLEAKERRRVDDRLRDAYSGVAEAMLAEVSDLLGSQTWPQE